MDYRVPDNWPLPRSITWYTCNQCGCLYGDGFFDQELYNDYYRNYYGYGVNSTQVNDRLTRIASDVLAEYGPSVRFVDFGGSGDDGLSVAVEYLKAHGCENAHNVNAGEPVPFCDVLLASHVLEHVYDMNEVMEKISGALSPDGLLIVDGPDATGILLEWEMPMLDFHTKHINHFRMIDYLRLMDRYGYELVNSTRYVDVRANQRAECVRLFFKRMNTAQQSRDYVQANIAEKLQKLRAIDYPVNVWGLGDMCWHILAQAPDLQVLNYIDNDPAMRGATIGGKPILETPVNDAPIVVISQGQKSRLLDRIKAMGIPNEVIQI